MNAVELSPAERIALAIDVPSKKDGRKFIELAADMGLLVVKFEALQIATEWEYYVKATEKKGLQYIADLKSHTTPSSTVLAVRKMVENDYPPIAITMHIASGKEAMQRAQEAAGDIAVLGVALLTTDNQQETFEEYGLTRDELMSRRTHKAARAGLKGVVCSPLDINKVKLDLETRDLYTLVTGVRLPGSETHEQANVASPEDAIRGGADLVVVAREVLEADNPGEMLSRIINRVEEAA